jgi:membrane protein implicated in regulation of membrane protease activity
MIAELARLAFHAVAATPSWTLWLGLTTFMTTAGILSLLYERSRRRTYVAILEVIQPGTLLLGRTHRRREIEIIRPSRPRLIADSNSADFEDVGR